jgi:hypothetical protein
MNAAFRVLSIIILSVGGCQAGGLRVVIVKSAWSIPLLAAVWALKDVAPIRYPTAVYAARLRATMVIWLAGARALGIVQ